MINLGREITDTYEVLGEIAQGGGGTVYEAYHKRLRKKVVLKKQHDAIRGLVNERTETDTLKNLRHSYLPQVLDFIVTDDAVYTVMDYIPGQSVGDILRERNKLSEQEVIKYARQLCDALVYLHNSKPPVIHGDIKPDNIMITPEGDVCLIDFNISSALGAANTYAFGYTTGYAAPEQRLSFEYARNTLRTVKASNASKNDDQATEILSPSEATEMLSPSEATEILQESDQTVLLAGTSDPRTGEERRQPGIVFDKRSDIYSYGATLYHMLTGIKPSSEPGRITPVLDIYPMLNRGLADIITKSMEIEPENRFQSFDEIKKILDNIPKYDLEYRAKVVRRIATGLIAAALIGIIAAVSLTALKKTGDNNYRTGLDQALALYYDGDHEGSIDYINDNLIGGFYFDPDKTLKASAYHLRANDWFEMEQYDNAIEDYDAALSLDPTNALIYRDKAIALARSGETDKAIEVLDEAGDLGLESADLMLAKAEIETSRGNTDKAIELYNDCIDSAGDDQTRARAAMLCASLYDHSDASQLSEAIDMLEKASAFDSSLKAGVLEQLAQCHIDMADLTGDESHYNSALDVFTQIVDKGWDTYTTHNNMVILYEQMGDLGSAEKECNYMLEKYGDNYNTYKRLAFLEIEKQNTGDNKDYTLFEEYYEKAEDLYKKQSIITDDMEMNILKELRGQI